MPTLSKSGEIKWELRDVLRDEAICTSDTVHATRLTIVTSIGDRLEIELFERGDGGFQVRGLDCSLEILPEASNTVTVRGRGKR